MTYKLNPSLFVEHGPAVLARRTRTSAREFELLRQPKAELEPQQLDRAA